MSKTPTVARTFTMRPASEGPYYAWVNDWVVLADGKHVVKYVERFGARFDGWLLRAELLVVANTEN